MKIFGKSDIGIQRLENEDVFDFGNPKPDCYYAIVCDGMGGTSGGGVASKEAMNELKEKFNLLIRDDIGEKEVRNLMKTSMESANQKILDKAKEFEYLKGMGTTVIAAIVIKNKYYIGYIGDSRGYLFKNKELKPLTTDHSFVQLLLESGEINEQEARVHPRRNEITRAVGITKSIKMDFVAGLLENGDKLLLCSDGLNSLCTDEEIESVINEYNGEDIVKNLIDLANTNGGKDNITVVIIE